MWREQTISAFPRWCLFAREYLLEAGSIPEHCCGARLALGTGRAGRLCFFEVLPAVGRILKVDRSSVVQREVESRLVNTVCQNGADRSAITQVRSGRSPARHWFSAVVLKERSRSCRSAPSLLPFPAPLSREVDVVSHKTARGETPGGRTRGGSLDSA